MLAKRAADRPPFTAHPSRPGHAEQMDARANQQPQRAAAIAAAAIAAAAIAAAAAARRGRSPGKSFRDAWTSARAMRLRDASTTPRTSSPTGAVRSRPRQHFDCPASTLCPPPTECARGSAQDAAPQAPCARGGCSCGSPLSSAHSSCCAIRKYPLRVGARGPRRWRRQVAQWRISTTVDCKAKASAKREGSCSSGRSSRGAIRRRSVSPAHARAAAALGTSAGKMRRRLRSLTT